jgi:uncharacterized protein (TIGR03083 family)
VGVSAYSIRVAPGQPGDLDDAVTDHSGAESGDATPFGAAWRRAGHPVSRSIEAMEWDQLRVELATSTSRVGEVLRSAPPADAPVPGSAWSVGEVGAHLVSIPARYRRMLAGRVPFPDSLSALNEQELVAVGTSDLGVLADRLESETADLLAVLGDDGDRPVLFFGMQHTAAGVGGIWLGELLLHGRDLARGLSRPWVIRSEAAIAVTRGLLPTLPHFLSPGAAARAAGVYHLHLRGGDHWTIRVADGEATVEAGRPERADVHISAEPVTNLLVGYGRIPRWRAALTGSVVAWGRKPWLAARFGTLFAET